MELTRSAQLRAARSFIDRVERSGMKRLFISGADLRIESISPRIHICRTDEDFEIFRYCGLLQSVPSGQRIGRRISALVYDDSQRDQRTVMGAIGLASSMYTLGCRDTYLGWVGRDSKNLKETGLKRIMDLALCVSVPPYSFLLGGKLMALLAMTDPFRKEFRRKYGAPLLGVGTSCATGLHCPIFNRIMVRPGGLYRHIGETVGYTISFFSADTMRAARLLASSQGGVRQGEFSLRPMRILNQALRVCDLPYEPLARLGLQKAIYFGVLSEKALSRLKTGGEAAPKDKLSTSDAIEYWKVVLLSKRAQHAETLARLRSFTTEQLRPGEKMEP
ncbi:MAG: Druantia anti-phage system protein DruA [Pyrinomonadaceae bacterium]